MDVNIDPIEQVRAALQLPDPVPDDVAFAPMPGARGTTVVVYTRNRPSSYYVDAGGAVYRMPSSCGSPEAFERLDPTRISGLRVG